MTGSSRYREAPRQLGRIALKRRPAIVRTGDPEVDRRALLVALSELYGVPALDLEQVCIKLETLGCVPRELADHHCLVPVLAEPDRIFVAMRDPSDRGAIQEVEFVSGRRVYAYAAPPAEIVAVVARAYAAAAAGEGHFVGPRCPPATLERAGLAEPGGDAAVKVGEVPPPVPEQGTTVPAEAPEPSLEEGPHEGGRAVSVADELVPREDGKPYTAVSAYPPRLPSLPPSAPPALDDGAPGAVDALSLLEEAFESIDEEVSSVCDPPRPLRASSGLEAQAQRVLLVDDEPEVRALLKRVLTGEGYDVTVAGSGQEAMQRLKEERPDVLILDAMLPEVHGFEIARSLRGTERYAAIPIVMISAVYRGWRFAADLRESCGIQHYIEKPFSVAEVKRAVAAAVNAQPLAAPSGSELSARAEKALEAGLEAYRAGSIDEAIDCLRTGTAIDPLAFRLHFHLGLLYARQGRTFDAIRALERAVEINPRHFAGVKNLAIMYSQAGFRNRAAELWERGLGLTTDETIREAIRQHLMGLLSQDGLS